MRQAKMGGLSTSSLPYPAWRRLKIPSAAVEEREKPKKAGTPPSPRSPLLLKNPRIDHADDHQARDDQRRRHRRDQEDAAPTGRELPPDDPVLALEVAPPAHEQDQDGDAQEGGAQRFAHLAKVGHPGRVVGDIALLRLDRRVEPEQLRDGDADGGERERGAQPG